MLQCGRLSERFVAARSEVAELYPRAAEEDIDKITFIRACGQCMKVTSAKKALELFVARCVGGVVVW